MTSVPKSLTSQIKVIADLYERYVDLIGNPINAEGDTMTDGYVETLRTLPQALGECVV